MMMQFHIRLYATGGEYKDSYKTLSSAEYSEDGSTFVLLTKMPEAKYNHCMTVFKNGDIFVAGGANGHYVSKSVFIYEVDKKQWRRCPDMLMNRLEDLSCGIIKREDGREEIVVVGACWTGTCRQNTVEIYNNKDSKWRSGIIDNHT
jgi:hypothetical protein